MDAVNRIREIITEQQGRLDELRDQLELLSTELTQLAVACTDKEIAQKLVELAGVPE